MKLLRRCLRHLWLDADDALRAVGEAGIGRLEARVRASEQEHSGQICLCVEASLPPSYLWRHVARGESIEDVVRDRALTLFGKQRVWDTEHNNGVLVYLLLAEHRIEIVGIGHIYGHRHAQRTMAHGIGQQVGDRPLHQTAVDYHARATFHQDLDAALVGQQLQKLGDDARLVSQIKFAPLQGRLRIVGLCQKQHV